MHFMVGGKFAGSVNSKFNLCRPQESTPPIITGTMDSWHVTFSLSCQPDPAFKNET